jgi:hypothetical protein
MALLKVSFHHPVPGLLWNHKRNKQRNLACYYGEHDSKHGEWGFQGRVPAVILLVQ